MTFPTSIKLNTRVAFDIHVYLICNMSLEHKLEHRNIKPTTMRLLVLKELVEAESAISLKELEARFERADKATLFRTLKTFEKQKLIHRIEDGTGASKYALCKTTCECQPQDQHVHFKISGANMVFQGVCAGCA